MRSNFKEVLLRQTVKVLRGHHVFKAIDELSMRTLRKNKNKQKIENKQTKKILMFYCGDKVDQNKN